MPAGKDFIDRLPNWKEMSKKYGSGAVALGLASPANPLESTGDEITELPSMDAELRQVTEAGVRALNRIQENGPDVELPPDEAIGLEAIVLLTGRPPILIQNGRFFPPPEEWAVLEQNRAEIETVARSVGRIELNGHPSLEWVGTGFLVADDVMMTNRHVAEAFCQMGLRRKWQFKTGMSGHIDYVEELNATQPAEFTITNIIGVHEQFDLALFRVQVNSATGQPAPKPLTLATQPPNSIQERNVYVIGYPAWDGQRNDPAEMQRIFTGIFNVKRLQPGMLRQFNPDKNELVHDCSTLGGNSGSCVVDLETHKVVGLHFGGKYLQGNRAVALWRLINDPLIKKAGLNFG